MYILISTETDLLRLFVLSVRHAPVRPTVFKPYRLVAFNPIVIIVCRGKGQTPLFGFVSRFVRRPGSLERSFASLFHLRENYFEDDKGNPSSTKAIASPSSSTADHQHHDDDNGFDSVL